VGKRQFGSIRKLPSGKWQVRWRDSATGERVPMGTFDTKGEAARHLDQVSADIQRGGFVDPRRGQVTLDAYAADWLGGHGQLRPTSRQSYKNTLRLHISPTLGNVELGELSPTVVRRWHADLLGAGVGRPTVARAYRLLRAMLNTAVQDGLIIKNPCALKGASNEGSPERPIATVQQVEALAAAVDPRYRAMVLVATYGQLRFGELIGLRGRSVNLLHRTVSIVEQAVDLDDGSRWVGPPKTDAGRRVVSIPQTLVVELELHLAQYAQPGPDGLVFTSSNGAPIRRDNFRNRVWVPATREVGVEGLHFHDLRHTGNTLAAATGASTRELMARMGHSSPRAALLYQHATSDRDRAIADALGTLRDRARPPERDLVGHAWGTTAPSDPPRDAEEAPEGASDQGLSSGASWNRTSDLILIRERVPVQPVPVLVVPFRLSCPFVPARPGPSSAVLFSPRTWRGLGAVGSWRWRRSGCAGCRTARRRTWSASAHRTGPSGRSSSLVAAMPSATPMSSRSSGTRVRSSTHAWAGSPSKSGSTGGGRR
jgi:integrase